MVDCDATAEQLRTEQARTLGARTGGTGTLDSDPSAVHSLKRGATVDVKASAIFDCARWKKGGKSIDILRDRPAW